MKIRIICVGKKHNLDLANAISKYEQRLKPRVEFCWQIIPTSKDKFNISKLQESVLILKNVQKSDFVILLDEAGKIFSNLEFSQIIEEYLFSKTSSDLVFIIGGAYGVSEEIKSRANVIWSLSKLVFPHQIVRLILVEQMYRTFTIIQNHPYHHK